MADELSCCDTDLFLGYYVPFVPSKDYKMLLKAKTLHPRLMSSPTLD